MDIRRRVAGLSIQDIKELKRRVSAARIGIDSTPVLPRPADAAVPASLSQARVWAAARSDSRTYCISAVIHLGGELDVAALRRALDRIVHRHEVLHTHFREALDVVSPATDPLLARERGFALTELDLPELRRVDLQQHVVQLAAQQAAEQFDLSRGPLIRGQLLRGIAAEHLLLLQIHHAVADAASLEVMLRELGSLYAVYCDSLDSAGEADPLPALPFQYADYAIWQRQWLRGETRAEQLKFWKQQLTAAPALLELPYDRPRVPTAGGQAHACFRLEPVLVRELEALSNQHQVSPEIVLLAGFALVLAQLSRQQELVIAIPAARRHPREAAGSIGPFGNTLALRVSLAGNLTLGELLRQLHTTKSGAHDHEALPFEQLVEALEPSSRTLANPICQVQFELSSTPPPDTHAGVAFELLWLDPGRGPFDLALRLCARDEAIVGQLSYDPALFQSGTIARWVEHYHTVLRALAADVQGHRPWVELIAAGASQSALEEHYGTLEYQRRLCRQQLEFAGEPRQQLTLRRGSDAQPPLFLIHDLTGDVWPLHPLATQLPASLTVIGLTLPSQESLESIERLAAAHVRAMRGVQPQGPYRIAGHSVGGVVACEVARQLLGAGESVGFIGLIDTTPTNREAAWNAAVTGDGPLLLKFLEYRFPNLSTEELQEIGSIQDFDAALRRCQDKGLLPDAYTPAQVRRWIGNARASLQASARYVPARIAAPCVFFQSDEEQWVRAPDYWRAFLGEHLRVLHVGSSHFGIIRTPKLAQEIAQVLGIPGQQA
jgi:thioesterase domain-containing protein